MLKLISVNMEGEKHYPRILGLIQNQNPDIICLQEAPESFQSNLQTLGFTTDYLPMRNHIQNDVSYSEGLIFASKLPFSTSQKFYYQPDRAIPVQPNSTPEHLKHAGYIFANVLHDTETYNIAVTHLMVTPDGHPNEHQEQGVKKLLSLLQTEKSHILCGDFNMPRGHNSLYEEFIKTYTDKIPAEYTSSLDQTIHRLGKTPNLNAPIFDIYMVDYLFTKPEYTVDDVRLQFGVSDHAAVVANISKSVHD